MKFDILSKKNLAYFLLSFILLANTFNAIVLSYFSNSTWILASKEILLGLFFVLFFLSWKKLFLNIPIWFFIVLAILISSFFISNANNITKIASLRQIIIPYVILFAGFLLNDNKNDEIKFYSWLKASALYLVFASIAMYFVLIYNIIDFEKYFEIKQAITTTYGIPFMFYDPMSGDFVRNVSTFLDPINLGHALLFLFLIIKSSNKSDFLFKWIIFLFMALTICKGAYLQLIIIGLFLLRNKIPILLQGLLILFGIFMVVFLSNYHEGIKLHLEGFLVSIKTITFFGHGLGMVGNQSLLFGTQNTIPIYDTFIGSIIGQLGIVGFVLWLLPFVFISSKIYNSNKLVVYILSAQLIVSVLSENAFNFLSIYFLMLLVGFSFAQNSYNEK
ncbi:MAG: hypothetical protein KA275_02320 [Chitinophagaceae bacterium]|nr:hypothetical protein [Chitinophagaceae bacterium]